jgi:hypothetical protein
LLEFQIHPASKLTDSNKPDLLPKILNIYSISSLHYDWEASLKISRCDYLAQGAGSTGEIYPIFLHLAGAD